MPSFCLIKITTSHLVFTYIFIVNTSLNSFNIQHSKILTSAFSIPHRKQTADV